MQLAEGRLMAKRKFILPGINDLSKEQHMARSLPKNGQHLIVGGPGTGKSVMALLRCMRHAREKENYIFLVYNHLLNKASRQLFGNKLISQQWQSWYLRTFSKMTGKKTPQKDADKYGFREIDWDTSLEIIRGLGKVQKGDFPYLIIDEGQDMPPQFYQALAELGFENFYVVADQNQQLEPERNSKIEEIRRILGLERDDIVTLRLNYRNTLPIARLAREFYTEEGALPPDLPLAGENSIKPVLVEYGAQRRISFTKLIGLILKAADRDPRKLIGIITPNNNVRNRYHEQLNLVEIPLDNSKPRIVTYAHGQNHDLSFDEGGIMIINAKSCKGLEFDTVFVADINEIQCWPEIVLQKKKTFYVMTARAINQIVLLKEAGKASPIDIIIPQDPNILELRQ